MTLLMLSSLRPLEWYAIAISVALVGALAYLWWVSPARRGILSPIIAGLLGFLAALSLRPRKEKPDAPAREPEPDTQVEVPPVGAPIDFEQYDETNPDDSGLPGRPSPDASDEQRASDAIDWWNTHNWD